MVAGSVADSWFVNTQEHIIRRGDYKGSKERHAVSLAFDAFTLPAVIFVAAFIAI